MVVSYTDLHVTRNKIQFYIKFSSIYLFFCELYSFRDNWLGLRNYFVMKWTSFCVRPWANNYIFKAINLIHILLGFSVSFKNCTATKAQFVCCLMPTEIFSFPWRLAIDQPSNERLFHEISTSRSRSLVVLKRYQHNPRWQDASKDL